jgi:hypothetical protein
MSNMEVQSGKRVGEETTRYKRAEDAWIKHKEIQ